ncbi:peptidoglycan recognition family protein [Amycolatopsis rhabdoformis]|uniref:N-acetylmuramoyl-L-alanine amidase n=1 Tax=Amycolatopsis rhabdoformis TaxID=1448059 RepID=A0ABZ1HUP9_9PSEU|nr:peptidoglycan recognition family protein [Amycolatopsis rhabdoformis]WSE26097.1 peptidoglycan recognition family protein [Amycolatopsis rhabdoformis]
MMLTSLATIARSAGLNVVEQPGWATRGHGQMSGVKAVVCHHTAGPATGNAPSLGVVQNGRSDLPGPLAHYVLGRDGTVYVVAAGLCYHAGAVLNNAWSNNYAIGIEAEATGTAAWPDVQMDAYARLCRALCTTFSLPLSAVLGHKEVCAPKGRKVDPNFDMGAFRARLTSVGTTPASGGGAAAGGQSIPPANNNQEDPVQLTPGNKSTSISCKGAKELVISVAYDSLTIHQCVFFGPYNKAGDKNLLKEVAPSNGTVTDHYPWVVPVPEGALSCSLWWELAGPDHGASVQLVF